MSVGYLWTNSPCKRTYISPTLNFEVLLHDKLLNYYIIWKELSRVLKVKNRAISGGTDQIRRIWGGMKIEAYQHWIDHRVEVCRPKNELCLSLHVRISDKWPCFVNGKASTLQRSKIIMKMALQRRESNATTWLNMRFHTATNMSILFPNQLLFNTNQIQCAFGALSLLHTAN